MTRTSSSNYYKLSSALGKLLNYVYVLFNNDMLILIDYEYLHN
jgi:hypothetical protein